jgi:hypothetical protein
MAFLQKLNKTAFKREKLYFFTFRRNLEKMILHGTTQAYNVIMISVLMFYSM